MTRLHRKLKKIIQKEKVLKGAMVVAGIGILISLGLFARSAYMSHSNKLALEKTVRETQQKGEVMGWGCPASVWIICNPNAQKPEDDCNEEYAQWVRASCKGFQGVIYSEPKK